MIKMSVRTRIILTAEAPKLTAAYQRADKLRFFQELASLLDRAPQRKIAS